MDILLTDPEEIAIIRAHRKAIADEAHRKAVQATCPHEFDVTGHSHNGDFTCRHCGITKFE